MLGDRIGYFFFLLLFRYFFCFGGQEYPPGKGEEESEAKRGGGCFVFGGRGGDFREGEAGWAHRDWEGVCGEAGGLSSCFWD